MIAKVKGPHNHPRPGPAPRLLAPFAALAEPVYRYVLGRRNQRFDRGRGVIEFDRPVISVGNLSVGGTGKTPTTRLLIRLLREQGHWPCVAMRGYRQHSGLSDEAAEYRSVFPDLPMVVQPNRADGLLELFASENGSRVDCVLLDDGFQHRKIARQLDIVLIDATRDPSSDCLLPRGWLREPLESLARAHLVVLSHAESVPPAELQALSERVSRHTRPGAPVLNASHVWEDFMVHDAVARGVESLSWLAGKRCFVCCAIGNPDAFVAQVRRHATVEGVLALPDHDAYREAVVRRLTDQVRASGADTLVVTRKDWAKLSGRDFPFPVAVPRLEVRLDTGVLRELVAGVWRSASWPHDQEPEGA
ncbi:MAG: tetraacyldisaccharide 4'-kinase [Phycisphaerales bacterium]